MNPKDLGFLLKVVAVQQLMERAASPQKPVLLLPGAGLPAEIREAQEDTRV